MSQSILRKRKMKNLFKDCDVTLLQSKIFQKKSLDLMGQTKHDYSLIISQIQKRFPQIPYDIIQEMLSKNEDDLIQVMNQVQTYVDVNKQRDIGVSDEEWVEDNELKALQSLVANPSNQNMRKFFMELKNEQKEKFDEKESETYKKTQATNFILKEAVKIQKKNLDETKKQEQNDKNEIHILESQIQQVQIRKQILKEQIESLQKQPQLIQ